MVSWHSIISYPQACSRGNLHRLRIVQSNLDHIAVLFVMKIDPKLCEQSSISFVDVKDEGYYKDREQEILFATHSIFRIERMEQMKDGTRRSAHVGSSSHIDG